MSSEIAKIAPKKRATGRLAKVRAKPPAPEPYHSDPAVELRRLVKEHSNLTRIATSFDSQVNPKTNRETGEVLPQRVPDAVRVEVNAAADSIRKRASALEPLMKRELKKLPIWEHFFSRVGGFASGGPIPAYMVASIDIHKAVKPSNLIRYCGYAMIDNHIERLTKGEKPHWNANMRMRLRQWSGTLVKGQKLDAFESSPYLKVLRASKAGDLASPLYDKESNTWFAGGEARKPGLKIIDAKAHRKAITRMLEDLYIVWRAVEGLPAWPTYYEQSLKAAHGGVPLKDLAPVVRTTEEAKRVVFGAGAT